MMKKQTDERPLSPEEAEREREAARQRAEARRLAWARVRTNLKHSYYVTSAWNWLLSLLSRGTEPILFITIAYSGYELYPKAALPPAVVDSFIFLLQLVALDIGGMGLLKLAKRAGVGRQSYAWRVGATLIGLMIANMVIATLKRVIVGNAGFDAAIAVIEVVLLIARAVLAVLYGTAIASLKEFEEVPGVTVREITQLAAALSALTHTQGQMGEQIEQLVPRLGQMEVDFQTKLSQAVTDFHAKLSSTQSDFHAQLSGAKTDFHAQLSGAKTDFHAQLSETKADFSASHTRLSEEVTQMGQQIADWRESQQQTLAEIFARLARIPAVPAGRAAGRATGTAAPAAPHTHTRADAAPATASSRPALHALPAAPLGREPRERNPHASASVRAEKEEAASPGAAPAFSARDFVFAALDAEPEIASREIMARAAALGQRLPESSVSRHRTAWKEAGGSLRLLAGGSPAGSFSAGSEQGAGSPAGSFSASSHAEAGSFSAGNEETEQVVASA